MGRMLDLGKLNTAQREAVEHGASPLLVLAGAGTGKTTVITYRIARFIHELGVPPDAILAVTFTNKAAREMRERTARLVGVDPHRLSIGTFHRICGQLLRRYASAIGLSSNFVIYDEDDQLRVIKHCLKELNLDPQVFKPRAIRFHIEAWKNKGLTPNHAKPSELDYVAKKAAEVYRVYSRRCLADNAVDFGDMILHTAELLRTNDHIREKLQQRWSHLLVDEYQDTNTVQYQLLKHLAGLEQCLTVVGDDDQSIYRWRGADVGNILRFERDFDGAKVIRLEQNYRSTQTILDAANAVIKNNVSRKGKTLFTEGDRGEPIELRVFQTERDEGEAIAEYAAVAVKEGVAPNDIGVLYRTNAQSRAIEDGFRRRKLPYTIYGGTRFYERKEIKDAVAYLRLVENSHNTVDFERIINVPKRGLGKTSIDRIMEIALSEGISMYDAAKRVAQGEGKFSAKARTALKGFVQLIERSQALAQSSGPDEVLGFVLDNSGYTDSLRAEGTEEAAARVGNLSELYTVVQEYMEAAEEPSLSGFLEDIALAADVDGMVEGDGSIAMMTLHSAKGLEFPIVFMPGMEDGLFPHSRSTEDAAAYEEERRLCYVGMTRAKEVLVMSAARVRTVFGQPTMSHLSPFLTELPHDALNLGGQVAELVDREYDAYGRDYGDALAYDHEPEFVRDSGDPLRKGARVNHKLFGEGIILDTSMVSGRKKLTIDFPAPTGKKVIMAQYVDPI